MERINVLNKVGFLTDEDVKEKLVHTCNHITFTTCLNLSEPIEMHLLGSYNEISLNNYSKDIASFITWWTHFVRKDLNGFQGFHNVKFIPKDFKIV